MKCNLIEFSFIPLLIAIDVLRVPLCLNSRFLFNVQFFLRAIFIYLSCIAVYLLKLTSNARPATLLVVFVRTIIFVHNFFIFLLNAHQFDINRKKYKIKQVLGEGQKDNAGREKELTIIRIVLMANTHTIAHRPKKKQPRRNARE